VVHYMNQIFIYPTYDECLIKLGYYSLKRRRVRADLLICYKIHHSVDLHQEDFFTMRSIIIIKREAIRIKLL